LIIGDSATVVVIDEDFIVGDNSLVIIHSGPVAKPVLNQARIAVGGTAKIGGRGKIRPVLHPDKDIEKRRRWLLSEDAGFEELLGKNKSMTII